jgi:hypothetical protein
LINQTEPGNSGSGNIKQRPDVPAGVEDVSLHRLMRYRKRADAQPGAIVLNASSLVTAIVFEVLGSALMNFASTPEGRTLLIYQFQIPFKVNEIGDDLGGKKSIRRFFPAGLPVNTVIFTWTRGSDRPVALNTDYAWTH